MKNIKQLETERQEAQKRVKEINKTIKEKEEENKKIKALEFAFLQMQEEKSTCFFYEFSGRTSKFKIFEDVGELLENKDMETVTDFFLSLKKEEYEILKRDHHHGNFFLKYIPARGVIKEFETGGLLFCFLVDAEPYYILEEYEAMKKYINKALEEHNKQINKEIKEIRAQISGLIQDIEEIKELDKLETCKQKNRENKENIERSKFMVRARTEEASELIKILCKNNTAIKKMI